MNAGAVDTRLARRRELVAQGLNNSHPVFIRTAAGAKLWDVAGKEYIDLTSGIGVNNLGHGHPAIMKAIVEQAKKYTHTCFQTVMYDEYLDLAEQLHMWTPGQFAKKSFFTMSGAEAVEGAVKFARAYTGRNAIITFTFAFHGRTFYALEMTGRAKPYRLGFGLHPSQDIRRIPFPYPYRFDGGGAQACAKASLDALEMLFITEMPADSFAALVFEPILGESGIIVAPDGFFQRLSAICHRHRILLIADEVQTGIGRTGAFCASSLFDIEPDLIALAKSLGFGLPIGAVTGRAEILDALGPGGLGGTMGGNPLACQAGLAGLRVFQEEDVLLGVRGLSESAFSRLEDLKQRCSLVGDVRGRGLMIGVELVKDRNTKEPAIEEMNAIVRTCRQNGVLLLYGGAHQNLLRILPPLIISGKELDQALDVVEAAVIEVDSMRRHQ